MTFDATMTRRSMLTLFAGLALQTLTACSSGHTDSLETNTEADSTNGNQNDNQGPSTDQDLALSDIEAGAATATIDPYDAWLITADLTNHGSQTTDVQVSLDFDIERLDSYGEVVSQTYEDQDFYMANLGGPKKYHNYVIGMTPGETRELRFYPTHRDLSPADEDKCRVVRPKVSVVGVDPNIYQSHASSREDYPVFADVTGELFTVTYEVESSGTSTYYGGYGCRRLAGTITNNTDHYISDVKAIYNICDGDGNPINTGFWGTSLVDYFTLEAQSLAPGASSDVIYSDDALDVNGVTAEFYLTEYTVDAQKDATRQS